MSRGFDVYKRKLDATQTSVSQYVSTTLGAGVRFGVPISDEGTIHYGLSTETTKLGLTSLSPQRYIDYVNTFGSSTTNLLATAGWSHDSRDSAIYTTDGVVQRASTEIALPVSNQRFYKLTYQHQWFHPLTRDFTLMLNGEAGMADGYGGKPLPFFKNFYAGGIGSVRGYQPNSLGALDPDGNALGGNKRIIGNAELLFPVPGMAKEKSVRLSLFADAGGINGMGWSGLRYSTGMAVAWISPVGPLKVSVGVPLKKQTGDKLQRFQFTLGSLF
jgi:outer membrane protein insertion porin family